MAHFDSETNRRRFIEKFKEVQELEPMILTEYERDFMTNIDNMLTQREQFSSDWSPSVKQVNFLWELHRSFC